MKLTPLDIQQHEFRSIWRGYDPKEVEQFMDLVASEFEDLIRENNLLKEEIIRLTGDLSELKDKEQTLKETMITAQKISEDIRYNAQKEAEIVVSEGQVKAQDIVNSAQLRSMELIEEIKELKRQKIQFEENLRALLNIHHKMLETAGEDENRGTPIEEKLDFIKKKQIKKQA
jgi:cell division initiation protein